MSQNETPDTLNAALLALLALVPRPKWRWMPGMLVWGGEHITERTLALVPGLVPDPSDPATVGCLLALADEAAGPVDCTRENDGRWCVEWPGTEDRPAAAGYGATRGEALVALLLEVL